MRTATQHKGRTGPLSCHVIGNGSCNVRAGVPFVSDMLDLLHSLFTLSGAVRRRLRAKCSSPRLGSRGASTLKSDDVGR
jgi:hypothetical protein